MNGCKGPCSASHLCEECADNLKGAINLWDEKHLKMITCPKCKATDVICFNNINLCQVCRNWFETKGEKR